MSDDPIMAALTRLEASQDAIRNDIRDVRTDTSRTRAAMQHRLDALYDGLLRSESEKPRAEVLLVALKTVLDLVDYTADPPNCRINELVGAVLPMEVILLARVAIAKAEGRA